MIGVCHAPDTQHGVCHFLFFSLVTLSLSAVTNASLPPRQFPLFTIKIPIEISESKSLFVHRRCAPVIKRDAVPTKRSRKRNAESAPIVPSRPTPRDPSVCRRPSTEEEDLIGHAACRFRASAPRGSRALFPRAGHAYRPALRLGTEERAGMP
eukprot:358752-Chlamydomonas_euryale.AAC.21